MADILPDKGIEKLLEEGVILNGDKNQIRPNSYVFRLGVTVRFFSTNERKTGEMGDILEIEPGDSVLVTSVETLKFEKISDVFKNHQICAFLTPTTTLVREGLQLPTTKIDPGYGGTLNWTIRNDSVETVKLEIGEPIFKATFFLLSSEEELSEKTYGQREEADFYHNKEGLVESKRRLPVDLENRKKIRVSSKGTEIERLKKSGFPYNFIATQLQLVGENIEIVSKDFAKIEAKVEAQSKALSKQMGAIEKELREKLDEETTNAINNIDNIIFKKMTLGGLTALSTLLALGAGVKFLIDKQYTECIAPAAAILAVVIALFALLLSRLKGSQN